MNGTNGRLVFVDALRGYALMGLFLIHMVEYFELYWLHPEPGPVNTLMFALFGGKPSRASWCCRSGRPAIACCCRSHSFSLPSCRRSCT